MDTTAGREFAQHESFVTILAALVGLGLAFIGLHYLVEPLGVWWGFAGGLAIAMAWSVMLWLLRRARA